ncbi:MAG TPA: hypothetical protein VGO98_02640 [Candidatus Saccharimonadales bacterium]|jgi:hypothetical protein|nr:hypothetical protein [Candidatus Saccharimonadales bacterium]
MTEELSREQLMKIREDFYEADGDKHHYGQQMLMLEGLGVVSFCAALFMFFTEDDMRLMAIIASIVLLALSVLSYYFSCMRAKKVAGAKAEASHLISAHPNLYKYPIRGQDS